MLRQALDIDFSTPGKSRERERKHTASRIFMNVRASTGEDIDKNSMTLTKEITARGKKKKKTKEEINLK